MSKLVLGLVATTFVSQLALAAGTKYSLRKCTFEETQALDVSAMDIIKSNNFSDKVVYTAVKLTPEASPYSGQSGHAGLTVTDKGLFLNDFKFCASTKDPKNTMSRDSVSIKEGISLSEIILDKGEVSVSLEGEYLASDEHEAVDGSELTLKYLEADGEKHVIEAKLKLKVAETIENKKPTVSESVEGTFYLHVGAAKLSKK